MIAIYERDLNIAGEAYDTIDEFYRVNGARERNAHYADNDYAAVKRTEVAEGCKDYSWDDTRHDMLYGSDLFDEEFGKCLREVELELPDAWKEVARPRARADVSGQSVNVGRALAGHPKSFQRREAAACKRKAATFLFSIGCPWRTSVHDRMKAGCMMMAICQHLELKGCQTRVLYTPSFAFGSRTSRWNDGEWPSLVLVFRLKDFKSRFNLRKMQFPLASKSALFHVGCWWAHRVPMQTADWGDGEGYTVDIDEGRLRAAREYARRQGAVYLSVPAIVNDFKMDLERVYEYVMRELGG